MYTRRPIIPISEHGQIRALFFFFRIPRTREQLAMCADLISLQHYCEHKVEVEQANKARNRFLQTLDWLSSESAGRKNHMTQRRCPVSFALLHRYGFIPTVTVVYSLTIPRPISLNIYLSLYFCIYLFCLFLYFVCLFML